MESKDCTDNLQQQLQQAFANKQALHIQGSGSKAFLSYPVTGTPISSLEHCGIVNYEPSELSITVRSGTHLDELEKTLSESGQMLAFEPPRWGEQATIGGTIACNVSGVRRPYTGAARDFVLGVKILNGRGEVLRFGGEVMKNVAGYDVSRLMTGAFGTLGMLLEVSLKVLPKPAAELSLAYHCSAAQAIETMNTWAGQAIPLSAACHHDGQLRIRLSGAQSALKQARQRLGGEPVKNATRFWHSVNEHQHAFFKQQGALWRIACAPATPVTPLKNVLANDGFIDWGGAQRYFYTELDANTLRQQLAEHISHATLLRGGAVGATILHPLPAPLLALHQRLKQAFDPAGILNPGCLGF